MNDAPSQPEAGLKLAPSQPNDPMFFAAEAQRSIDNLRRKIEIEAGLIRQIMVFRHVRRFRDRQIFQVQEVRLAFGKAVLHGRSKRSKRKVAIGGLTEIEIVNVEAASS